MAVRKKTLYAAAFGGAAAAVAGAAAAGAAGGSQLLYAALLAVAAACLASTLYLQVAREVWPGDGVAALVRKMRVGAGEADTQAAGADALYAALLQETGFQPPASAAEARDMARGVVPRKPKTCKLPPAALADAAGVAEAALVDVPGSLAVARAVHGVFRCLFAGVQPRPPVAALLSRSLLRRLADSMTRFGVSDAEAGEKGAMALGGLAEAAADAGSGGVVLPSDQVAAAARTLLRVWEAHVAGGGDVVQWCMWALVHFANREQTATGSAAAAAEAEAEPEEPPTVPTFRGVPLVFATRGADADVDGDDELAAIRYRDNSRRRGGPPPPPPPASAGGTPAIDAILEDEPALHALLLATARRYAARPHAIHMLVLLLRLVLRRRTALFRVLRHDDVFAALDAAVALHAADAQLASLGGMLLRDIRVVRST